MGKTAEELRLRIFQKAWNEKKIVKIGKWLLQYPYLRKDTTGNVKIIQDIFKNIGNKIKTRNGK
jgi:hypothetical protein